MANFHPYNEGASINDTLVADNGWFRYVSDNVAWCGWVEDPIGGRLFSLWHRARGNGRHRDFREGS